MEDDRHFKWVSYVDIPTIDEAKVMIVNLNYTDVDGSRTRVKKAI